MQEMTQAREDAAVAVAAAEWHARLAAPDMDWDGFADWLAAAPTHRVAYDRVALADSEVAAAAPMLAAMLPANDGAAAEDPRPARPRWAFAGAAAAIAAVGIAVLAPSLEGSEAQLVALDTGPDETRVVTLLDGSTIRMDRGTHLALRDGSTRQVSFASGNASFDIRHDASRPFAIQAGDYRVEDLGTRFDVSRRSDHVAIAIAEGGVRVVPSGGTATELHAGARLDFGPAGGVAERTRVDPADVGSWRRGRLVYQATPLRLVASDVSRYTAKPVTADPAVADLRFSGVLTIGDGSRLVGQLQELLPVAARDANRRVVLVGRTAS